MPGNRVPPDASIAASSGVRMTISSFDEPASSMVVAGIAMQVVAEVLEGLLSAVGRVLGRDLSELRRMSIRPDGATRYEPERCRTRTIGIRSGCLAPALVVADRAGDTRSARGDSEGGASDENRLALEGHELLRLCREFER